MVQPGTASCEAVFALPLVLWAVCCLCLQAPDAAAIRAAITEEARRRGIEHTLKEERTAAAQQRRNLALPRQLLGSLGGVDDQLVQILEQALDGQFNLANLRLSDSGDGTQQAEEEEVCAAWLVHFADYNAAVHVNVCVVSLPDWLLVCPLLNHLQCLTQH